jgi:hypothetical protein
VRLVTRIGKWFASLLECWGVELDYKISMAVLTAEEMRIYRDRLERRETRNLYYSAPGILRRIGRIPNTELLPTRPELEFLYEVYIEKGSELESHELMMNLYHFRENHQTKKTDA